MEMLGQVAIIMGSKSDFPKMVDVFNLLDEFMIHYSVTIASAHRTPAKVVEFTEKVEKSTYCKVVIAAAGMAAALPGCVAAGTTKPVIGLPLSDGGSTVNEVAATLAMLQMPPGVPILTVGVNSAKNAALSAISIMANVIPSVQEQYKEYREEQAKKVIETHKQLQSKDGDFKANLKCMYTLD